MLGQNDAEYTLFLGWWKKVKIEKWSFTPEK